MRVRGAVSVRGPGEGRGGFRWGRLGPPGGRYRWHCVAGCAPLAACASGVMVPSRGARVRMGVGVRGWLWVWAPVCVWLLPGMGAGVSSGIGVLICSGGCVGVCACALRCYLPLQRCPCNTQPALTHMHVQLMHMSQMAPFALYHQTACEIPARRCRCEWLHAQCGAELSQRVRIETLVFCIRDDPSSVETLPTSLVIISCHRHRSQILLSYRPKSRPSEFRPELSMRARTSTNLAIPEHL